MDERPTPKSRSSQGGQGGGLSRNEGVSSNSFAMLQDIEDDASSSPSEQLDNTLSDDTMRTSNVDALIDSIPWLSSTIDAMISVIQAPGVSRKSQMIKDVNIHGLPHSPAPESTMEVDDQAEQREELLEPTSLIANDSPSFPAQEEELHEASRLNG
jgi:hypothetical protein